MRTGHVETNWTCNQRCRFCTRRRAQEAPAFVRADAVQARVEGALRGGERELVLTGGEPGLRRDLPAIVSMARRLGAERVVLETNATTIDAPRARALADAGLSLARVHVAGVTERAVDAATQDPGGFARTLDGVEALLAAGISVEAQAPLVAATLDEAPALPAFLRTRFGGAVRDLALHVPFESESADALLDFEAAGAAAARVAEAGRAVGVAVRMAPPSAMPPCFLPEPGRHAHLFSLHRGGAARAGFRRVAACAPCRAVDRCPGLPEVVLARDGAPSPRPITDDRVRRRLSVVGSVREQLASELVSSNHRGGEGSRVLERIVRVSFHCNQACAFCFVSTHLPPPEDSAVREAIEAAARDGARVTLSGGEPTLNARLVDWVRLAKARTGKPVELQTNATRLDDALVARLVDAGLDEAFVSLHGATAACSDAVTGAPGTFAQTLDGLDALGRSPLQVIVNFVICRANHEELPALVRLVRARWPRARVNVSFVASSTDVVARDRAIVPAYREIMPSLADAFRVAATLGVELEGLEAMCGVPLCLVPADLARYLESGRVSGDLSPGEFMRAEACDGCALRDRCHGIRRGYVELYGADELRRVAWPDVPAH